MKHKYYPPEFKGKQFHCIHCNVFAAQDWGDLFINTSPSMTNSSIKGSRCNHCWKWTFWYDEKMIIPAEAPVEPPHEDLPGDCISEYTEAREIFSKSPRAAAALLRLCLQKLMPHLGEAGSNLNDDIKSLVSKGLPAVVQKALDVCRVIGNNAVHPGEIDLNDTPETAQQLFHMINFTVEDRITRPKQIDALYNQLPEKAKDAIKKRDNTKE